MEHRLHLQHRTKQGRCRRQPPAPLEVVEVIHREPVADVPLLLLHEVPDILNGFAPALLLDSQIDQQALAHGGGAAVHDEDFAVRMVGEHLLGGDAGRLVGGGQARGEADAEDVPACRRQLLHRLMEHAHADGGGRPQGAAAQPGVEIVRRNIPVVRIIEIFLPVHNKGQGQDRQLQLLHHLGSKIAAAVGQDGKIAHKIAPFAGIGPCGDDQAIRYHIIL